MSKTLQQQKGIPTGPFHSLVVFGESNVQGGGWLSNIEERWSNILCILLETAQEQPLRYYNAGLGASVISPKSPGYAASVKPSALERLEEEVIIHTPDIVVIAYGLNDMRAGMPAKDFKLDMQEIVERIRKTITPMIVICNVYHMSDFKYYPPFNRGSLEATIEYNKMLRELCVDLNCVYADIWSAEGLKDWLVHPDTVHASKVGNMLIANKVFEAVVHAAPGIVRNVQKRDKTSEWTKNCFTIRNKLVEHS